MNIFVFNYLCEKSNMQRIRIYIIAGLLMIGLGSCGGNSGGGSQGPVMFALVNSDTWRSPNPNAVISDNSIDLFGTSASGKSIHIRIESGEIGEYYLGISQGHEAKVSLNTAPGTVPHSTNANENGSGFVRISSINEEARTLSGNFYFTAYKATDNSSIKVTEGQFSSVPYRFVHSSDTTTEVSNFTCVDNSVPWTATKITPQINDTAIIIKAEIPSQWESIEMIFPHNVAAGVHSITSTGPVYVNIQKGFYTYPAHNGSATIIEHNTNDKKIRGTFFFNYTNHESFTFSVTNGQFEVFYNTEE